MNVGPVQILIIALVVLILFGRGRISEMMGDFGKGVKSFRQGLNEDPDKGEPKPVQQIEGKPSADKAETTAADTTKTS